MRKKKISEKVKREKTCCLCGWLVNHKKVKDGEVEILNLNYDQDIICDRCLVTKHCNRGDIKLPVNMEQDISEIKRVYEAVEAREIVTPLAISCLEMYTDQQFTRTRKMRVKMRKFIAKHDYKGVDLRRAQNIAGLDQQGLGKLFRISKTKVVRMETNKMPLSKQAIDFILEHCEGKKFKPKKVQKTLGMTHSTYLAKNAKIPPEREPPKKNNASQYKAPELKQFTKAEAFPHLYPQEDGND